MKVYYLGVLLSPEQLLVYEANTADFNFFQRTTAQEFMVFFSKTLAKRTRPGLRQNVVENMYVGHVFHRTDDLIGVVLTDAEYPQRVAQSLINKILDDFAARFPKSDWSKPAGSFAFPELKTHLTNFQNPAAADSLTRIQKDLDETKIVLHDAMQRLLERGEKLDDLVARSEDLSQGSKSFYRAARKTNSCCVIL